MIITGTDTIVKGNVGSKAKPLTIDPAVIEHIMSVLTNIYSNNNEAVAREYVANAFDSHTLAGQDRPVEVTLPNEWEPRLIVQDFGVGLTKVEIEDVYGGYGISTKRDNNEEIGGLGLGSKSGFTLGGQFVVTGIKEGHKTVALFALNHRGVPTVEVLHESDTTDPNGVTVSIAVDDVRGMKRAVENLSRTWPKDKVLIDGVKPANNIYDSAVHIGEEVYLVDRGWGFSVEMGGIVYHVPPNVVQELDKSGTTVASMVWQRLVDGNFGVIARLPIGAVAIAPNRETLRNTPETVAALQNILTRVGDHYSKKLQEICDTASTGLEANVLLRSHTNVMGASFLHTLSWKGNKLGQVTLEFPHIVLGYNRSRRCAIDGGYRFNMAPLCSEDHYSQYLFVTGVKPEDVGKVRRLATRYLTSNTNAHTCITLVPESKGSVGWFSWGDNDCITTMTLPEYREAVRKIPTQASRNETRYENYVLEKNGKELYWRNNYGSTASEIAEAAEGEIYFGTNIYSLPTKAFKEGDRLVGLNNRQSRDKLEERLDQELVDASKIAQDYAERIIKGASTLDLLVMHGGSNCGGIIALETMLSDFNYSNPDLAKAVSEYHKIELHDQAMTKDRREELRSVRYQLPGVADPVKTMYDEWVTKYILVEKQLRECVRWGYRNLDSAYVKAMVEYMQMVDNKEAK